MNKRSRISLLSLVSILGLIVPVSSASAGFMWEDIPRSARMQHVCEKGEKNPPMKPAEREVSPDDRTSGWQWGQWLRGWIHDEKR